MAATAERESLTVTEEDLVHVGPGTVAGEYLRRFWHPVYVSAELPVGIPKPIRILSEEFTLYRGESGAAHVLGFRCAHRGNQLSLGWVEGDSLRCYYHGWRYDATGQCDRQPHEENAFCDRIKIPSYPVQEYVGLIFLYLGPEPVPQLPRYPLMEQDGSVNSASLKVLPYNYFQSMENNVDSGHVPFVHRRFHHGPYIADADEIEPVHVRVRETPWGIENSRQRGDGEWTLAHFLMPNIHCIVLAPQRGSHINQPRPHYSWRTPVDDQTTLWINAAAEPASEYTPEPPWSNEGSIAYAGRVIAGEERIHDIENVPHVTNQQDMVSQWGQGTIADRSRDHLGKGDAGIVLMREIYRRELQALRDGHPLKQWTAMEEAVSTRY